MRLVDIKTIARQKGVRPGKLKKAELIRAIQNAEKNIPCFAAGILCHCERFDCLWRDDCR